MKLPELKKKNKNKKMWILFTELYKLEWEEEGRGRRSLVSL